MSIEFGWDNEAHTVILVILDDWTWDEFHTREEAVRMLITSVDYPVDFILWFKTAPPVGMFVSEFYAIRQKAPANLGRTVIIEDSGALVKVATSTVQHAIHDPLPIIYTKTLEEARAALANK